MKDQKRSPRFWYMVLATVTLLLLFPVAWYSYLKPAIELTNIVSATDEGAPLDVPQSATFTVDALVE